MAYIESILSSFLGDVRKHNEDTGQIAFDCCSCEDGHGKGNLEINYFKDVFKCWVCKDTNDMYGSITRLIKRYGTPKILKDYKLFKPEANPDYVKKVVLPILPEGYKLLETCSSKNYKYTEAMSYLTKRGITPEMISKYKIGYTTEGVFFNRIIIPSYDADGMLNYFVARSFDPKNRIKYLNPDIEKQLIIFNESLINWDSTIYLVEGATDSIVIPNSIPLLGKYISDVLLEKLHDNANANIVILFDGDAFKDSEFLYEKLSFGRLKGRIRICVIPEDSGLDPSKINEKWGRKGIIKLLRRTMTLEKWKQNYA